MTWVQHAMQTWRANTDKTLWVSTYEKSCYNGLSQRTAAATIAAYSLPDFYLHADARQLANAEPDSHGNRYTNTALHRHEQFYACMPDFVDAMLYRTYGGMGTWQLIDGWSGGAAAFLAELSANNYRCQSVSSGGAGVRLRGPGDEHRRTRV